MWVYGLVLGWKGFVSYVKKEKNQRAPLDATPSVKPKSSSRGALPALYLRSKENESEYIARGL